MLRKLLLVLMSAAFIFGSSPTAVASDNPDGAYVGIFTNSDGASHRMLTEFANSNGEVAGKYLAGNSDVVLGDDAGSLRFVSRKETGFTFRWTDRWGTGLAYLTFTPDFAEFSGTWTFKGRVEGKWTGTRR